jgi:hypothetical protein
VLVGLVENGALVLYTFVSKQAFHIWLVLSNPTSEALQTPPRYPPHSDHPPVFDQVTGVSSDSTQYSLRAVVPNDSSRSHGVLDHQAELSMRDAQSEESSKRVVDV